MGARASKTLKSEDVSKNCALFAVPQTSNGDPDKVKAMANTRVIVDTLVGSSVFGSSPHEGIARNMIDSYKVMVYTLAFTHEEYQKYGRFSDGDVFTGDDVTISFLVILKNARDLNHLGTYLTAFKKYLKKYDREYDKFLKSNENRELSELKAFVRGAFWNQNMIIYELSILGIEREDVEKAETELGEINPDFPRFDPDTTSIRHFTARDSKILYIFADALHKTYKKNKNNLVYTNYKGYVSDGATFHTDAPYYDLHLSSQSPDHASRALGAPRSPGTIILIREKHLSVARARVRKRIEELMKERQKKITVEDLYVFEALHSFCDTCEYRSSKTLTNDMFLLSEEDKILVKLRTYSEDISTISSWMKSSQEFNLHQFLPGKPQPVKPIEAQ